MRAARAFAVSLPVDSVAHVHVDLYGSLALTGKGHATDRAILLGLSGETPDGIDPAAIEAKQTQIRESGSINLAGLKAIPFHEETDLVFHKKESLPGHPNAMRFTAFD